MGLLRFEPGGDEEEGGIDDAHDEVVEALVARGGQPPFEGDDEEEDLDEVEGGDEDVFVRGADELHRLLREEGHVFVDGVVGDVGVGAVVEGDEDVEEDCGWVSERVQGQFLFIGRTLVGRIVELWQLTNHDHEGENVIENQSKGWREVVESLKVGTLHDAV